MKKLSEQWQFKKSVTLFKSKILSLEVTPSRHENHETWEDFYRVKLPECVCIISITPEKKMVMIRQFRHGTMTEEIELPGGCIDASETILEAATRELEEETGYVPQQEGVIFGKIHTNPVICSSSCHFVFFPLVEKLKKTHFDENEEIETFLITPHELLCLLKNGEISHAFIVAALGQFFLQFPEWVVL